MSSFDMIRFSLYKDHSNWRTENGLQDAKLGGERQLKAVREKLMTSIAGLRDKKNWINTKDI